MDQSAPPMVAESVISDHCRLCVPSQIEAIEPTVDFLTNRAVQVGAVEPARAARVTMALHEALTNAVIHGNLEVSSELKEHGDDWFARAVSERCADPGYANRVVTIHASFDGSS